MEILNSGAFDNYHTHLEGLVNSSDNGIIVAASNLNLSKWTGKLFYFKDLNNDLNLIKPNASLKINSNITNVILSQNDRLIISTVSGSVMLIDLNMEEVLSSSFSCLEECNSHDSIVHSISLNQDFTKMISTGQDRSISIYDFYIFKPIASYVAHKNEVIAGLFVSFENDIFVTADQDNSFILWDIRKSKPAHKIEINFLTSIVTSIVFEPSKTGVLTIGTDDGHLFTTDIRMPQLISSSQPHTLHISKLLFAPNNSGYVASCGFDSKVAVTNISAPDGKTIYEDMCHRDYVKGLTWKDDTLLSCSWDGTITSRKISFNNSSIDESQENL